MGIEFDHCCSRCGSKLEAKVQVISYGRGEPGNFNIRVQPCRQCIKKLLEKSEMDMMRGVLEQVGLVGDTREAFAGLAELGSGELEEREEKDESR